MSMRTNRQNKTLRRYSKATKQGRAFGKGPKQNIMVNKNVKHYIGWTKLGNNHGHGGNVMWETWELHCPSRGQTLTHNDNGTFTDHVAAISRDCPDWNGGASTSK